MSWTLPDLRGRVAIVTGANSGLGLQIATTLAGAGATVVLACRNQVKGADAVRSIRTAHRAADVSVAPLDLADLSSVRAFATAFAKNHDRLDLLINNAGLMAVDQARTVDGFEMQFGVNHLGHFALTNELLPLLTATPASRVASMSSFGHRAGRIDFENLQATKGYHRWPAYFQSKLANLLFTAALQERLSRLGSTTLAVTAHPGFSRTDLGTEGASLSNRAMKVVVPIFTQSAARGALPMLRAATDPSCQGGEFFGPRFMTAGAPVLEKPSRRARDRDVADRLWTVSAQLTAADHFVH